MEIIYWGAYPTPMKVLCWSNEDTIRKVVYLFIQVLVLVHLTMCPIWVYNFYLGIVLRLLESFPVLKIVPSLATTRYTCSCWAVWDHVSCGFVDSAEHHLSLEYHPDIHCYWWRRLQMLGRMGMEDHRELLVREALGHLDSREERHVLELVAEAHGNMRQVVAIRFHKHGFLLFPSSFVSQMFWATAICCYVHEPLGFHRWVSSVL